jgi:hypothetical protein
MGILHSSYVPRMNLPVFYKVLINTGSNFVRCGSTALEHVLASGVAESNLASAIGTKRTLCS